MIEIWYKNNLLVTDVFLANNLWKRFIGYMFQSEPRVKAILFIPAVAIHTFFMRFQLDVVFMDKNGKIIKIYRNLKPWRHTFFYFKSTQTLELPAGTIPSELKEGECLEVKGV